MYNISSNTFGEYMKFKKIFSLFLGVTSLSLLITSNSAFSTPSPPIGDPYICTRTGTGRVNIRKGPGINHPKGLEQVGSGGISVTRYFESNNNSLPSGFSNFTTFVRHRVRPDGSPGWSKIGNNQWIGWVRNDFLCYE